MEEYERIINNTLWKRNFIKQHRYVYDKNEKVCVCVDVCAFKEERGKLFKHYLFSL